MSSFLLDVVAFASFAVSSLSLFITIAAYRRLDNEASATFAVIGADEGNHEARLERLETEAGFNIIPSPSAMDVLEAEALEQSDEPGSFEAEFADEHENVELQAANEEFENEGGGVLPDDSTPSLDVLQALTAPKAKEGA